MTILKTKPGEIKQIDEPVQLIIMKGHNIDNKELSELEKSQQCEKSHHRKSGREYR